MMYRAAILLFALLATTANGQAGGCIQSLSLGTWVNPFAGYKSDITKLEIREICTAETVPHIQVKTYTACAPRDCTWGRAIAKETSGNRLTVSYNTFYAKRTVTVSINGRRMDAKVLDDFHDSRKPNGNRSFVLWKK
ncbi:hypothetical protein [Cohaesibacter celericrescens]|nr:hypothetical protein [Cohaesibacter celericrescens]